MSLHANFDDDYKLKTRVAQNKCKPLSYKQALHLSVDLVCRPLRFQWKPFTIARRVDEFYLYCTEHSIIMPVKYNCIPYC